MMIKLFSNYLPLLCLTACVWVSCSQNREKKSGKKDHTPVMRLTTTTIEVPQSYVADVQAVQFVEVKPKVEGFVEAVLVDEGEHVKKGQVLFKLSSAELYEEVKEAQANHKQAQARVEDGGGRGRPHQAFGGERYHLADSSGAGDGRGGRGTLARCNRPNPVCNVRRLISRTRRSRLLSRDTWTASPLRWEVWLRRAAY